MAGVRCIYRLEGTTYSLITVMLKLHKALIKPVATIILTSHTGLQLAIELTVEFQLSACWCHAPTLVGSTGPKDFVPRPLLLYDMLSRQYQYQCTDVTCLPHQFNRSYLVFSALNVLASSNAQTRWFSDSSITGPLNSTWHCPYISAVGCHLNILDIVWTISIRPRNPTNLSLQTLLVQLTMLSHNHKYGLMGLCSLPYEHGMILFLWTRIFFIILLSIAWRFAALLEKMLLVLVGKEHQSMVPNRYNP